MGSGVRLRECYQLALLRSVNGVHWRENVAPSARFDFDDDHGVTIARDDVDLAEAAAPTAFQNLVAFALQFFRG
jgi:hypothetical protein